MQLKGLVRFFAIALILICLYQLSFTWMVHSHESTMEARAALWLKANYPTASQKYPGNKELAEAYTDSLQMLKKQRLQRLLDSTKDSDIGPFGLTTYQNAKDKELMLGLDLQGGMSVTMEVGLDGLIHSLANYTKDPVFNKALETALERKANSGADLITLFGDAFRQQSNGARLAPYFVSRSDKNIKFSDSDDAVLSYLRSQATNAFDNTTRILRTRIDRFGVSSPNINPDPQKGRINLELPGINDPDRVRRYLQSTANLQFFDVYNISEVYQSLTSADKALSDYLGGIKATDSSKLKTDSSAAKQVSIKTAASTDTNKVHTLSLDTSKSGATKVTDTTSISSKQKSAPITSLLISAGQGQKLSNGGVQYPAYIAAVATKDTGLLNSYLNMDIVKSKFPSTLAFVYGKPEGNASKSKNALFLYAIKTLDNGTAELEGDHVSDAKQDYDEKGRASIKMNMDATGTRIWAKMTERNSPDKNNGVGKPIAIVLDNIVYSAPYVNGPIPNGSSEITGNFTVQDAQDLADILQSGKLPAPAKIVQEQVVGPTLGQEAVRGGSLSFVISFVVIFALMLIYYNTAGWVANIALILNLLFTIGILSALGFTLTAPGIAALVLTVGLAVDTNVIIFERIKEELSRGKGYLTAVTDGYKRSYPPVIDAHVTTFLSAAIIFYFGLGPVRGFATTQMLGITLSLFCGILVSRLVTDFYTNKNRHFNYFTGLSKKVFQHASFKFIEYRKIAYGISVVVLILGVSSFFNGFDKGVEFEGGRSYTINFDKKVTDVDIRDDLKKVFGETPVIKTVGTGNQLDITTTYKINERGNNIDSLVEVALMNGLKNHLPANITYTEFDRNYKQGSQTVQPSISDDLRRGAQEATVIAIIVICLYIFIRFRDWRYSLGTIVSLLHDVFVTLTVFSFLRKVVPFPMEIDQHFIAAILTVIGFSMNDTVIVYDRIREDSRLMKGMDKATIINTAINQTLSRTIMTSLTVFLTILILFIFGGEVTRGFAFAMLIGVVTGTYSSIFVAAPILVDFGRNKPLGRVETSKSKM